MRPCCFKAMVTAAVSILPKTVLCNSESECIPNFSDSSLSAGKDRTELQILKN